MSRQRQGRRPNGDGSIYYVADRGVWKGAVTLPNGKRRTVTAPTRPAAAKKLQDLRGGLGAGGDPAVTVAGHLRWWLDTAEAKAGTEQGDKSINTVHNYRWALTPVIDQLGSRKLADLQPEHVEWLLAELAGQGKARTSVTRVRAVLAQALDVALKRGQVSRNVARLAEMPRTPAGRPRRSLTLVQAGQLLEAAAGHRLEALVQIGLMLGLRPGELLGLTWADVDLDAATLTVRRSLKREPALDGTVEVHRLGDVKRGAYRARRTLTLPARTVPALAARQTAQKKEQLACGSLWQGNPHRLIFTSLYGGPLTHAAATGELRRLTVPAGLGEWSLTELFRHTAASIMADAGLTNEAIAEVYGHNTTRMLERHYVHQIRPTIDHHVPIMDTLFAGK